MRLGIVVMSACLLWTSVAHATANPDRRNLDLRVSSPFGTGYTTWSFGTTSSSWENRSTLTGVGGAALLTVPKGGISWLLGYAYEQEISKGNFQNIQGGQDFVDRHRTFHTNHVTLGARFYF